MLARNLCSRCYKKDLKQRNPEYARAERERVARWAASNKPHITEYMRTVVKPRRYGLSHEEYQAFLARPCGICGAPSTTLDHCHSSGRVRGGLCQACNRRLGVYETWVMQYEQEILAWLS